MTRSRVGGLLFIGGTSKVTGRFREFRRLARLTAPGPTAA